MPPHDYETATAAAPKGHYPPGGFPARSPWPPGRPARRPSSCTRRRCSTTGSARRPSWSSSGTTGTAGSRTSRATSRRRRRGSRSNGRRCAMSAAGSSTWAAAPVGTRSSCRGGGSRSWGSTRRPPRSPSRACAVSGRCTRRAYGDFRKVSGSSTRSSSWATISDSRETSRGCGSSSGTCARSRRTVVGSSATRGSRGRGSTIISRT